MIKKLIKNWWVALILLAVISVITVELRFFRLTILPIFADEAIYIRWAQVMRAEPSLRFLPLSDGKQPLFMWLIIPFFKFFSDPLVSGRAVSVLAGLGSAIGVFILTYQLFKSKKVSLVAALIYAISPFTFFFDRMALADSLLSMFGIWAFIFAFATAKTLRLDLAMITGFFLGGALLTKSPALFFILLLPGFFLFNGFKISRIVKLVGLYAVSLVIAYGIYNILRLGPNFNMISARNQDYVYPLNHLWTNPKDPFLPYFDRAFEWIRMMGPWPLLILAAGGLVFNVRKHWKEILILSGWFIIPIAAQAEFAKVFTARYILFSLPYLIILAASLFLIKNKIVYYCSVLVLFVFFYFSFHFIYLLYTDVDAAPLPRSERSGYLEEWTSGTGIKEVADYIISYHKNYPGRKIVVGTEGFFGTLPDGLEIYLAKYPEITVVGIGVIIEQVPSQLTNSLKAGNTTFLVINSSRIKIPDPAKVGLILTAAYPKAFRPNFVKEYTQLGPRENLLFFELVKS